VPELYAHGPAPAPLEVVALQGDASPDLVRTNMGLALALEDGSYAYGCPSQWGDVESAFVAGTPERGVIATVGGGALYISTDQGCSFQPQVFPLADAHVRNVVAWSDRIYGIAAGEDGGVVFQIKESLEIQIERELSVRPDSLLWASDSEGMDYLIVAGANPKASVWLAKKEGEDSLEWTQLGHDTDFGDVDFMSVRGLGGDGGIWIRVSQEGKRALFRADFSEETLQWEESGSGFSFVLGPVWTGTSWIAVLDGQVARWTGEDWQLGAEVNWTCLNSLQGFSYVCTLQQVFAVEGEFPLDDPSPFLSPVFHMNQFGPPKEECPPDYDEAIACQTDWLHYGGESGLVGKNPAQTPDGIRPVDPVKGDEGSSGGCAAQNRAGSLGFLMVVFFLSALIRADRRSRRADR